MGGFNTGLGKGGGGTFNTGVSGGFDTGLGKPSARPKFRLNPSSGVRFGRGAALNSSSGLGWLGSKLALAGHDLAAMPGGIYHLGKDLARPGLDNIEHGGRNTPQQRRDEGVALHDLAVTGKGFYQPFEHPLRDPFQTLLAAAPVAGMAGKLGEAGLAARAAEGGAAARAAEAAKALVRSHGDVAPRVLRSGDKAHETTLIHSRNAGVRLAQRGYDAMVQRAMDKEAQAEGAGRVTSRIAAHGKKRIGGALAEEQRAVQRMNATPADRLERSALRLSKLPLKAGGKLHSAALELTSTQTPPEVAVAYHESQALKLGRKAINASGAEAEQLAEAAQRNEKVADLYRQVHEHDLVHVDLSRPAGEKVFVNPAKGRLAAADAALAHAGRKGEEIIAEHNLMSPEGQTERINAPARVRAGAEFNKPTPGKLGVESHVLKEARSQVARIEKLHARAVLKSLGDTRRNTVISQTPAHYEMPYENDPRVMRISGALSVAKDRLQKLEQAHERRIAPTGLIGGENALPGRSFVGYRSSEKAGEPGVLSIAQRKRIGEAQSPIDSKAFTGENIREGKIPKNVSLSAAKHYRQLAKFANTMSLRRSIIEADGSALKRSGRDILIREPGTEAKPLTEVMKQALGEAHAALHDHASLEEIHAGTQEGLRALHQFLNQHILDRAESSSSDAIGTPAPNGYKWVDSKLAEQLQKDAAPRATGVKTLPGKMMDNTNAAITALTVYFKVGHAFTRFLTNAATNIMQGSLRPDEATKNFLLWKKLSPEMQDRLVAAAGQQGFAALPSEAGFEGPISRGVSAGARGGARVWARLADSRFRANSLLYELRKVGYDSPEKVSSALDAIQRNGKGLPAHEWSRLSAAFRRADREAISYDRLNEFEKRYLARAVWFYPWVKGSSVWTVRSVLEHPYKMAAAGNLGAQGRKEQLNELGPVPSYEQGLIDVGGGKHGLPNTVDMSTFSPVGTLGQLLNVPEVKGSLAQQLNPALGSLLDYAHGTNSYGEPSNNPLGDALNNLFAPTPEDQLVGALSRGRKGQSKRMFPATNWKSELYRYLLGPGIARRPTNKTALHKAAAREHEKRFTVYSSK